MLIDGQIRSQALDVRKIQSKQTKTKDADGLYKRKYKIFMVIKMGKFKIQKARQQKQDNILVIFNLVMFYQSDMYLIAYIYLLVMSMIDRILRLLPRKKLNLFGQDRFSSSSVPFYAVVLITALGLLIREANPFMFLAIAYSFFPIVDEIFSLDNSNPSEKERKQLLKNDHIFVAPLYTAIIISWMVWIKAFTVIQQMEISWYNFHHFIATLFIVSNLYAIQFVVTHELLHKPGKFNRMLGTLHMIILFYSHFTHHHLNTHHKWVATPLDPTTARKGETLYQFIPRVVVDSWIIVYNQEKKEGQNFLTNAATLSIMLSAACILAIYHVWGPQVTIAHTIMAFGAILYLETISYLQHYGLQRKKLPNGEYEKITIMHSWNAPHRFTNYLLFKLQRHSDHHENSSTPYQALVSLQESPFLPHGYNLMILMAFFPKTWFRIIDPLLEAYEAVEEGKNKKVDPEAIDLAVTETRKFLLKVVLSSFLLFGASVLDLI